MVKVENGNHIVKVEDGNYIATSLELIFHREEYDQIAILDDAGSQDLLAAI